MCGRFVFDDYQHPEITQFIEQYQKAHPDQIEKLSLNEVFPSENTIVYIEDFKPMIMNWGLNHYKKKQKIINARTENIHQSVFFNSMNLKPCVVMASGYFEWDKNKKKYYFHSKECIYLAGLYNPNNQFVILTKPAIEPYSQIHSRMPVVLDKEAATRYLKRKI